MNNPSLLKTISLTSLALIAFAANSVLCRLALGEQSIDASSFTIIRLLSGALILFIIVSFKHYLSNRKQVSNGLDIEKTESKEDSNSSWSGSLMLFIYALTFSFAYITLDTATGALILFGSVQITMILVNTFNGNRLHFTEWLGVVIAFIGFVYLMLPGINTPSAFGFFLMTISGIAWGLYTLKGRGSQNPLMDTAHNFIKTIPLVIVVGLVQLLIIKSTHLSNTGIYLAILSGAIASGVGYSIWYSVLPHLSVVLSAILQLLVPVIAALGGILFVNELITQRLLISALMILGGILLVIIGKQYLMKTDKKL